MDKVKRQRLIMLITVISSYYGFSDLYTFFSERVPEIDNRRIKIESDIQAKQVELGKLRDFAKNIEVIKQDLRELDIQLETALEALPRTPDFAELLRRLDLLAQNSGVELRSFRPQIDVGVAEPNSFYSTLRVDFVLAGSFTQALVFFDQMSRLKRLLGLQSAKFERDTSNRAGRNVATDASINIQGVLKTFQFKE